jgi:hypothetical protein
MRITAVLPTLWSFRKDSDLARQKIVFLIEELINWKINYSEKIIQIHAVIKKYVGHVGASVWWLCVKQIIIAEILGSYFLRQPSLYNSPKNRLQDLITFAMELFRLRGVVVLNLLPVELYLIYCTVVCLTCVAVNYLTFWHPSFTFNSNKSPTWCNNCSVYYPDVYLQLNMFATATATATATAVIELLMMGGKMPETCWAVNKLQDNKLKNCCIRLVIYLNCTMMHKLTNIKFYI